MYQRQFGLDHNPFTPTAQGDQVYSGHRQDKVLAKLKIALSKPDAIVAVVGSVGVGKSTLALRAAEASVEQALTAVVAPLKFSQDDLLELLIAEFGINSEASSNMARFQDLRCFFTEQAQDGYRPFVIVEDAGALGADNLKLLDALTAADPRGYTGANLILLGSQDLSALLSSVPLARLRQRLRAEQTIEAFTVEETTDYIHHRFAQAGGNPQDLLDPNVGQAAFQCTQGVARLIDNLMDTALSFAFSRKQERLSPAMVQKVGQSVYGFDSGEPVEAAEAPESAAAPAVDVEEQVDSVAEQFSEVAVAEADEPAATEEIASDQPESSEPDPVEDAPEQVAAAPAEEAAVFDAPASQLRQEATPVEADPQPAQPATVTETASPAEPVAATEARPEAAPPPVLTAEVSSPAPALAAASSESTGDSAATTAEDPIPVETPGNEIPVLEDAIDLALMEDDAAAIANVLTSGTGEPQADKPTAETPAEIAGAPQTQAAPVATTATDASATDSFDEWAANVAQAASLEELDAQIAETLFGAPELDTLGEAINTERQAAKPLEERDEESGGIVPNNIAGGGLG
jgi:type II secretory pathway predicted ATPase ExeA